MVSELGNWDRWVKFEIFKAAFACVNPLRGGRRQHSGVVALSDAAKSGQSNGR